MPAQASPLGCPPTSFPHWVILSVLALGFRGHLYPRGHMAGVPLMSRHCLSGPRRLLSLVGAARWGRTRWHLGLRMLTLAHRLHGSSMVWASLSGVDVAMIVFVLVLTSRAIWPFTILAVARMFAARACGLPHTD